MRSPRTLLFRTLGFMLISLVGLSAPGCISPPDYPDTPEIEFRNITIQPTIINGNYFDRVNITIGYRDGDGDLGSNDEDVLNYFCQAQIRQTNGTYLDYNPPADKLNGLNGRYPVLTPESQGDRKAPLRGEIYYEFDIAPTIELLPGTVIRFKVFILDRALHRSNEVLTNTITIPQ